MSNVTKLAAAGGVTVHDGPGTLAQRLRFATPTRSARRRFRWGRLVRWLVLAVAVPLALYLIIANVLLRTRLLRNLISDSPTDFAILGSSSELRLDYASAYSILPGRVHLEGLTIRGRERTVEWFLTLDHADVRISLLDLLRRRFHATRLRSSGFTIRARMRLDRTAAAKPDVVAALPPIEGFADPPLLDEGPEPPPLTDASYNLWTIDLEDVDVEHVREVWIHTLRSEGDSHVHGRWLFRPQRWLDVGPATVDANGVDVSYGSHHLATGLRGSSVATVYPFDVRQADGLAVLEHVSTSGRLRGLAITADLLSLLAPSSGVRITRCEVPFDAGLVLDHGKIADGTVVRTEATDCELDAKGLALTGPVRTEVAVDGGRAAVDTRISGLRVSRGGVEQARVASIAAGLTSRRLQIASLFDDARFTVDVGGATTNDIAAWQRYVPSTAAFVVRVGRGARGGPRGGVPRGRGRLGARYRGDRRRRRDGATGPRRRRGQPHGERRSPAGDVGGPSPGPLRQSETSSSSAASQPAPRAAARRSWPFRRSRCSHRVSSSRPPASTGVSRSIFRARISFAFVGLGELVPLPAAVVIEDGEGRAEGFTPRSSWAPDPCEATGRSSCEGPARAWARRSSSGTSSAP